MSPKRILVIRLGAFGDFILLLGTMAAIRAHHKDARVTLLTTQPYADLAHKSGYFDQVWTIRRWRWREIGEWFGFMKKLRAENFDAVYDLQRNDRTRILRRLAPLRLQGAWFGDAASFKGKRAEGMLDTSQPLTFPVPPLPWLDGDINMFRVTKPYALLVPGCSPQHPEKRWPATRYAALAQELARRGLKPVVLGTAAEADIVKHLIDLVPAAVSLCGKTSFIDIAALARQAAGAVGNDTGPMHLIAAVGCPAVSLFSGRTDPAQSAPRGSAITVLREDPIGNIAVNTVLDAFIKIARDAKA